MLFFLLQIGFYLEIVKYLKYWCLVLTKLWYVCPDRRKLVSSLLISVPWFSENIFTQQPSYYSDLEETVPTVLQVSSAFQTDLKLNSEQLDTFYSHQLKVSQTYTLVLLSTSGVWDHPGKMWPPLRRRHGPGADETKHTTAYFLNHESAGQIKPMCTWPSTELMRLTAVIAQFWTNIQSAGLLKAEMTCA